MKKGVVIGTIISAVMVICGVFLVVYNGVFVYNTDLKYFSYKNVEGTITSMSTSSSSDGNDVYYSGTYTFSVDGNTYGCSSDYTVNEDDVYVGKTATIKYDPKNPSLNFVSDSSSTFNYLYLGLSCILAIIGLKIFDKMMK